MARIDLFLFGYKRFTVPMESRALLAGVLLSLGICARINARSECSVSLKNAKKLSSALDGRVEFSESDILGLPGFIYKNRRKYGAFIGLLLALFIYVYSSGAVFDIRIECDEEIDKKDTLEELCALGLKPGARWGDIDRDEVEARLLLLSDEVGWVNINRRGTVAYVSVRKKATGGGEKVESLYTNVVSDFDGIVESITVKSGYAAVKVGDAVRVGDILISGIIPSELGGGFVHAEGEVKARVYKTYEAYTEREYTHKRLILEEKAGLKYKILDFSVNFLKNSRNLPSGCVIIEDKSRLTLFDRYGLPIELVRFTAYKYEEKKLFYTDKELCAECSLKMRGILDSELSDAKIISLKTDGEFTEDGYLMRTHAVAVISVGKSVPIADENE